MGEPSESDRNLLSQMLQEFVDNPGTAVVWTKRNAVVLKYLATAREEGRREERERCAKIARHYAQGEFCCNTADIILQDIKDPL